MRNFVSIGWTHRGHWVAVTEHGDRKILGPYPSRGAAAQVAADECTRLGMRGFYRGVSRQP